MDKNNKSGIFIAIGLFGITHEILSRIMCFLIYIQFIIFVCRQLLVLMRFLKLAFLYVPKQYPNPMLD